LPGADYPKRNPNYIIVQLIAIRIVQAGGGENEKKSKPA
jgi:hypothetical protein